jgi:hypothetical protein
VANNFQIIISAVDRATATFKKVNAGMERLTRPTRELKKQFESFGKEAQQFAKYTGLDKVGKSLSRVANAAGDVARKVLSIAPPLAAIASLGTIAGIAELAVSWGRVGTEIANTASVLGVSTQDLQRFRGAARLAGLSAEDMTGGLRSLGATLEDATFGRNQQALIMMNKFGISLHRTKSGAVDATRALRDVANAIVAQGGNVEAQDLVAKTFGVEQLLPLLQKGSAGIDQFVAQAQKLGLVMTPDQIASAQEYANRMNALDLVLDNLKNTIGNALIPVLQPLIEQFTQWVVANKDLIATDIGNFVKNLAGWIKTVDFKKMIDDVNHVADAFGGWKTIAIGVGLIIAGPLLSSVVSLGAGLVQLGALLWANPIIAALGTIAFLTYEVIKNFDTISNTVPDNVQPAFGAPADGKSVGRWGAIGDMLGINGDTGPNGGKGANTPLGIRSNNPLNTTSGGKERQYATPEAGIADAVSNLERNYRGMTIAQIQDKWTGGARTGNAPEQIANYVGLMTSASGVAANARPDLSNASTVSALIGGMIRAENGQMPYSAAQMSAGVMTGMAQAGLTTGKAGAPDGMSPSSLARMMASQGGTGGPTIVTSNQPGLDGLEITPVTGKVEVVIHMPNAPAGAQASVKTNGNVSASTRIGYSTLTQVTP